MGFLDRLFGPIPQPEPGHRLVAIEDRTTMARIAKEGRLQTRADAYPPLTRQIEGIWANRTGYATYREPSIDQALGSPSIFRAVSLIANTTGSLAVETYRSGVLLTGDAVPRLVTRPDPFNTANRFYRDTAYFLATRGEAWWWVAKRDSDDLPMSLIVVPPWEIVLEFKGDRLNPTILWTVDGKQTEIDKRDMRHITLMPDYHTFRGVGPLQLCGAAVSVSVESQEWAANFYAQGGYPSLVIKKNGALGTYELTGEQEADLLRNQFRDKPHNTPRVVDDSIESVEEFGVNPSGAQMLDARQHNKGDSANMFGVPGVLLEYSAEGSSLTYQNVQEVFRLIVQTCLAPNYLEPIEQELSDLLPRSTVARFNTKGFLRADTKARWETYEIMSRVIGPDEAARIAALYEGITPGDVEYAPVPFAPPAAFPTSLPVSRSSDPIRCSGFRILDHKRKPCNKLLAEAGQFSGRCPRCGTEYDAVLSA